MERLTIWNEQTEMAELIDWDTEEWKEFMSDFDVPVQISLGVAIDKLAHYEDLEEQGLLLKLPCKVGDECYVPNATFKRVFEVYCISISKDKENIWVRCGNGLMYIWNEEIFATKEEAEAKLKELENE